MNPMPPTEFFSEKTLQSFNAMNVSERKKIPEQAFRISWLPLFCGEIPKEVINNYLSAWRGLTGSLSTGADLVDASGKKILDIPPLLDHQVDFSKCNQDIRRTFGDIFYQYSMMRANNPTLARIRLANTLREKAAIEPKPSLVYDEEMWKALYKHFGRDDMIRKMSSGTSQASSSLLDDEIFVGD